MVDADHFKAVNDRYGHAAGDAALRALADRLRERLRTEDVAGRFGGEEFVIGLPDADAEGAAAVAEAVRAAVAARPLTIAGRELTLTVSVGWATWEDDDLGQLLARADGALYEAKAAGRDCVRPRADSRNMTSERPRPRCGDMSLSSRTLLTTAALAAAVIAPSAANAAEGFTAVTSTGDVVQLHSDTGPGLTGIHKVTGLAAGESVVGLDRAPTGELLGLTSAGNIASVDRDTGKATAKFAAARHDRRRPPNAAGDLRRRARRRQRAHHHPRARRRRQPRHRRRHERPGPHLRRRRPARRRPGRAVARLRRRRPPDRRRRGQSAYAVQTAAGAATLQTLAAVPFPTLEPLRSTVASDGSVWTASQPQRQARPRAAVAPRPLRPGHGPGPRRERRPRRAPRRAHR